MLPYLKKSTTACNTDNNLGAKLFTSLFIYIHESLLTYKVTKTTFQTILYDK